MTGSCFRRFGLTGGGAYTALVVLVLGILILLSGIDAAGANPFDSITSKTDELRTGVLSWAGAGVGLIAAVLLCCALFGVVAWGWVLKAVVAAIGLAAIDQITAFVYSA